MRRIETPSDSRRHNFTLVDNEFLDDPRATSPARSAYLAIVRHAYPIESTPVRRAESLPITIYMSCAGIRKYATWARAVDELARLGYLSVRMGRKCPTYDILAVEKVPPKRDHNRWGSGPHIGGIDSQKGAPIDVSSRFPKTKRALALGDREWSGFRKEHNRIPDTRAELEAWVVAKEIGVRPGTRD